MTIHVCVVEFGEVGSTYDELDIFCLCHIVIHLHRNSVLKAYNLQSSFQVFLGALSLFLADDLPCQR
jgi:hypothetical protein